MTLRELIDALGQSPLVLGIALGALPVATVLIRLLHGRGRGAESPWRYLYAVLVYLACIPGMFAAALTAYALLFTGENLLDQPVLVYLAPIATTFVTLMLMRKFVDLARIPGFGRLAGLMVLLGITFLILFLLSRLRFWVGFFGDISLLFVLGLFLFLLLKWAAGRLFRGPGEEAEDPPRFPL